MREYELVIDEALKNGLSPELMTPFNTQVLYECLGFRCGRLGLEAFTELDNPLPSAVDMHYNWPFPQYITGELYNILVVRDTFNTEDIVYSISDDHATVTQVFAIDELTFGQGSLLEIADFGEYVLMVNGVVMVLWNVVASSWQASLATATIPLMNTICNFKGQAVGGNIPIGTWHDCDETFYVWSKIGRLDFTPDRYNTAGYKRCPYGGIVYHTRRLEDNVVGYSSKGITMLSPVTSPAITFKFKELSDIGLINKGAMNGNLNRQVYVGEDYILREIANEGIKELGYQHLMEELAGEDIIVSYEPSNKNFYIGNSTKTFLLSPNGMTEVPQHPSAVWRRDKESFMLPDAVDSYEPLIATDSFDMDYKGQKTTATIESDAYSVAGMQAAVDYSNDINNWHSAAFKPVNNQGIVSITVSGNFFRFKLKFASIDSNFRIGYIKARYKMTDLRGIRGVYAPPLRGQ